VTGSWVDGVVIAWLTLMIGVIGAIGYAIATTGSATSETVARATNDAVQKAQEKKG
jgi:Na+-transporting methylmalonyl-CoA/oxaloacetate decarboxylase gamma subunit